MCLTRHCVDYGDFSCVHVCACVSICVCIRVSRIWGYACMKYVCVYLCMYMCFCVLCVCVCVCFQVTGGQFNLTLDVDHVYTLSTSTGQTHGDYPDVPDSQIFPVPYSDDFESEYICICVCLIPKLSYLQSFPFKHGIMGKFALHGSCPLSRPFLSLFSCCCVQAIPSTVKQVCLPIKAECLK